MSLTDDIDGDLSEIEEITAQRTLNHATVEHETVTDHETYWNPVARQQWCHACGWAWRRDA